MEKEEKYSSVLKLQKTLISQLILLQRNHRQSICAWGKFKGSYIDFYNIILGFMNESRT